MMDVLLIIIFTLIAYTVVLSRKTVLTFKTNRIRISYIIGFLLTMYVFVVHIKIAWENRNKPKFILFVFKQYFLRFDLPLIMLVEVVKENISGQEKTTIPKNNESIVRRWIKSKTARNEYSDILENQCLA